MFSKRKKFYFLSGLPRSGNTVLSSILNQNCDIKVSANSCLSNILYNIQVQRDSLIFKNFSNEQSLDDCSSEIFNSYYKSWKCKYIIDRSTWGTPANLKTLEQYCPNKIKLLCPVRDLNEILCSFLLAFHKSGKIDLEDRQTTERICIDLVENDEMIQKSLWSVENLLNSSSETLFIHYDNLCINPKLQIRKIYEFLNIPKFNRHYFNNIKQYKCNGILYDDSIFGYELHKIKSSVEKSSYLVEDILPQSIIKKYRHVNFDFLR